MNKEKLMLDLKAKLDKIEVVPEEAYIKLMKFITFRKFESNELIRKSGETEKYSYYLFNGVLALKKEDRIIRLFFPNHIAFDREAYFSTTYSDYNLVALKEGVMMQLANEDESRILQELPEFDGLSTALKKMTKKTDELWVMITQKYYIDAYPLLNRYFKGFFEYLSPHEQAQIFTVDKRTISRHNRYLHEIRNSAVARVKMGDILQYDFYSSLHADVKLITDKVVSWLKKQGLLNNPNKIMEFRAFKMTNLPARLYPETELRKSIWLGKLLGWLFLLEEYVEKLPMGNKLPFLQNLEGAVINEFNSFNQAPNKNLDLFAQAFHQLWKDFSQLKVNWFEQILKRELLAYITHNCWKAQNKEMGRIPEISDYLERRPFFSGLNLVLELIPFSFPDHIPNIGTEWLKVNLLKKMASELIFISNDILSFQKKKRIGDTHNWVMLMMHHNKYSQEDAFEYLVKRHDTILESFDKAIKKYIENYNPSENLSLAFIKSLKFQVSGTVTWSVEDTKRYIPNDKLANSKTRIKGSLRH